MHDYTGAFGDRVIFGFPRHSFLRPSYVEIPPARPPVYSCKKSAESRYFKANLQAIKKAHRNR